MNRLQMKLDVVFHHDVLFGVELLDPVTLKQVYRGFKIAAIGLKSEPFLTQSGIFVWHAENDENLQKITIDPGHRPFTPIELSAAEMQGLPPARPLKSVVLSPTVNYPFSDGVTGLVGTVIRARTDREPITDAVILLQWKDEEHGWFGASTESHSNANGDFVAVLRLTPTQSPQLFEGLMIVRLQVNWKSEQRHSEKFTVSLGKVTRPTSMNDQTFIWDELNS
ncbi:hypothetical protein [Gimesia aquarii]|uniref:Uncharacterized protein n=1 Tax=Gimesia aquarii TaxID=2527964 RepID=A0A517VZX8_9PLAN|nr:hypothetical protein [Gimesia aquarii]QDT98555.1 hypothetical protein V144x_40620 [Gimesia aquarii]